MKLCPYCDKHYHIKSIVAHKRRHLGIKPCKCVVDGCNSAFHSKPELYYHEALCHTRKRAYKCTQCGLRFIYKHELKHHVRTSKHARPLHCALCSCAVMTLDNLGAHMLFVHNTQLKPERSFLLSMLFCCQFIHWLLLQINKYFFITDVVVGEDKKQSTSRTTTTDDDGMNMNANAVCFVIYVFVYVMMYKCQNSYACLCFLLQVVDLAQQQQQQLVHDEAAPKQAAFVARSIKKSTNADDGDKKKHTKPLDIANGGENALDPRFMVVSCFVLY